MRAQHTAKMDHEWRFQTFNSNMNVSTARTAGHHASQGEVPSSWRLRN